MKVKYKNKKLQSLSDLDTSDLTITQIAVRLRISMRDAVAGLNFLGKTFKQDNYQSYTQRGIRVSIIEGYLRGVEYTSISKVSLDTGIPVRYISGLQSHFPKILSNKKYEERVVSEKFDMDSIAEETGLSKKKIFNAIKRMATS